MTALGKLNQVSPFLLGSSVFPFPPANPHGFAIDAAARRMSQAKKAWWAKKNLSGQTGATTEANLYPATCSKTENSESPKGALGKGENAKESSVRTLE